MVDGKWERDWTLLSEILAIIYNVNRTGHTEPITGSQLNPYVQTKRKPMMGQITDLKVFVRGGNSCQQEHLSQRSRLDVL